MGYQFIHLEGYARHGSVQKRKQGKGEYARKVVQRKWSARDIAAEAMREPGACGHVKEPQPPKVLYGCTPAEAAQMAEAWADGAKDAKGRALRRDGLALLAGVVSLPVEQAEDWPQFQDATVAWLIEKYGTRLRSVVEHTDEKHPHLHFYAVPLPGERFEVLHPGRLAASKEAQQGGDKLLQEAAFRKAMSGWQDEFQNAVAGHFGLVRLGPRKRRLSRAGWQAEQAQAKRLAQRPELPPDLVITPQDVAKRVTRKRLLGDEYESREELAARLTALVREQAQPLAALAYREDFSNKLAAQLRQQVIKMKATDNTARAVLAEKQAQELQQQLKQAEYRAQKAQEMAELYREGRDSALDELRELRDRGHDLER